MWRNDMVKAATLTLVTVLTVIGLSACGGGGGGRPSGPGGEVVITPPGGDPDLAVGSPSVSDSSPDAAASFTLSATVRNAGAGRSAVTTLRYYRSSDATISPSDTAVGTDAVGGLAASGTSAESISLTAPSNAGTYYYGACVDTVSGESDTANNCSSAVRVTVSASGGGGNSFGVGDALPGVPASGIFVPAVVSGASVSSSSGTTTITWNNGGRIQLQNGTRYSCHTAGGCAARNGVVTRGTIVRGGGAPPPSGDPDLTVGTPSVSDSSPDASASFTLSATVRNGGDGRSGATTLRYYRSTDATISASDTAVGTDTVGGLAASGTSAESIGLTAPSSAGTYYYGACVETVSGESNTANNCSDAVTVTVQAADGFAPVDQAAFDARIVGKRIRGNNPTFYTDIVARGRFRDVEGNVSYTGRYTYRNTETDSGRVEFFYDDGDRCTWNLTFESAATGTGTYSCTDGTSGTTDWRIVSISASSAPDLVVQSPSVSDSSPDAGASLTLSTKVRNGGDGRSEAATLRYYRSTDATISASDTEVGTDAVGGLAASGTSAESIGLTAPSSAGTYYYGACVDSVSGETDTANNCSGAVRVTVQAVKVPDLVVQSPSVSESSLDTDAPFTLSATVRNVGDGPSAATTLRYYRSSDATISTSDTAVGTNAVGALSASGPSAESIGLTAPSSAGTYYYGACVDTVSREADTRNNCSSAVRVTVSSDSDDHSDTLSGATYLPLGGSRSGRMEIDGDTDVFRVVITEAGTLTVYTTGSLDVDGQIWSSSGSILADDEDSGSGDNFRIRYPVTAGTYYIVVDSREDTDSYTLHAEFATQPNAPDLAVGLPLVSNSSPDAGASFTLSATVRNGGDGRSGATTLRYYRSTDATISASDSAVGTDAVGGLAASSTSAESVRLTAPSSAGTYYYGACVDTVSGESDTANNCSGAVSVTVMATQPPPADSACRVGMTLRPGDRCEGSGGLSGYVVVYDDGCLGGEFSARGLKNFGRICGSANLNGFNVRKNPDGSYTILALP